MGMTGNHDILTHLSDLLRGPLSSLLLQGLPVHARSAPGRLDVLGGLAWQAGGTLAQMALPRRAAAAVQRRNDGRLVLHHCDITPPIGEPEYACAWSELIGNGNGGEKGAKSWSDLSAEYDWAASILAAVQRFCQAHPEAFGPGGPPHLGTGSAGGLTIILRSDVPLGAGQANTAAQVTAVLLALADATGGGGVKLEIDDLAHQVAAAVNCLRPEHGQVVDALTCLQAKEPPPAHLLRFTAQGHQLVGQIKMPRDLKIVALDTGIHYTAASATVEALRLAGAMGLRIIETIYRDLGQRHTPLHGHLANLSPVLYRQYFRALLPRRLRGQDFLRTYGELPAGVGGVIVPAYLYHVRAAVDHLITEHDHAENFLQAMEELADPAHRHKLAGEEREKIQRRAGRLLVASHHSYRLRVELSCREADWLVDHLMAGGGNEDLGDSETGMGGMIAESAGGAGGGPDQGIYGARITGAGGGGTVAVLMRTTPQATDVLLESLTAYQKITGLQLHVQEAGGPGSGGAWLSAGREIRVG
ncbi:MAG: hypothetical protein WCI73_19545, partial [Phycisphaerae bacterium]